MSRFFQAPRYAATSYTIENLGLYSGATFSGELTIEPEGHDSGDWYILGAVADDPEDENKIIYFDANTNADTFKAICASVYSNVDLCMAIGDEARED